jgi:hypothetical protein
MGNQSSRYSTELLVAVALARMGQPDQSHVSQCHLRLFRFGVLAGVVWKKRSTPSGPGTGSGKLNDLLRIRRAQRRSLTRKQIEEASEQGEP